MIMRKEWVKEDDMKHMKNKKGEKITKDRMQSSRYRLRQRERNNEK